MAELYTYRPKLGIGKDLPEAELREFNSITYDKIMNLTDIKKLMRLEQYMREEEFIQTSQLARRRIVELGGKDMFPNEHDPQFCDIDAEFHKFMKNFDIWQESIKEADNNLLEMHESKEEEQPNMIIEPLLDQKRKRSMLNDPSNKEIVAEKSKKKKDVRSGRTYYEQWDKYATQAEKEIEIEKEAQEKVEEQKTKVENAQSKDSRKKETLQERLLAIGKSKSMIEREWFAEREREKGNDLFKAREYSASIDVYNMAIELFPKSPLAYGNRAASNIKLKRWEEVIKDCCIAIKLDGEYMKAYMRRGLANLEMDNPKDAMIDLNKALELDPNNQETQSLIRRNEIMLKKLEEKHAIEVELERKRKKDAELQEKEKEMEIFKNMTYSSCASKNCTRMVIEEDEDLDIEECSNLQKSKNCIENNIANKNENLKDSGKDNIVPEFKENKLETPRIYDWPNRPHKNSIKNQNLEKNEISANSMEVNKDCTSNVENSIKNKKNQKIENQTCDTINDDRFKKLDNNNDGEQLLYSNLCDVHVPPEIIEAIQTQESIPTDHVAFGHVPNKQQQSSSCKPHPEVEKKPYLKASDDMLAREWRLNGNGYFSQGKFHNAAECYTTSLKYQKSVAVYSNRAMSRIKLKNFRGAEEDATCAISMDCKFHKAYYRRGLARRALGNLQGAKADFEEVLKIIPNDKTMIQQLASIDSEYIPMRSGPMIIEEIEEHELDDHLENNNVKIPPTTLSTQESNDKQVGQNVSTNNSQSASIIDFNDCNIKTKSTKHMISSESNINNSTIKNVCEDKLKHQAKEEQEKGNICFNKKQYTLAIECYNQSLKYVSTNAVVLANRALCFINLKEYKKALKDSMEAIELDPNYIKAYHRRAVAAYKLGDLKNALNDFQIVAKHLPNDDTRLQKDIKDIELKIQKSANMNERFSTLKDSHQILTSEVCKDDEVILKPVKTTIYKSENQMPTIQQENIQSHLDIKNVCHIEKLSIKNDNIIKENSREKKAPLKVLQNIVNTKITIPQKPTSALEFERVCNSLKGNPNLAREYIKSIEICKYRILFKESLSASIMQCFIHILQKGFMPNDPTGAANVLRGLTKIKRFSLILLLISPRDKQGLDTLFYWLEFCSNTQVDDTQELRKIYQIL